MKIKNNYKSVVAIGGFNPSILTPGFLHQYCSFKSDYKPDGRTTPVLSEIKFGNIHFLMELNKFQILLQPIDNFEKDYPLSIILSYLNILEYTPLLILGVNFNYSISEIDKSSLRAALKDPFQLNKVFDITPTFVLFKAIKPNSQGLELNELTFVHDFTPDIKNRVQITFSESFITINDNYEVAGLDADRQRTKIIADNYSKCFEHNIKLNKQIGGY